MNLSNANFPNGESPAKVRLLYISAAVWGFALGVLAAAWNRITPPVFGYSQLAGIWVQCAILIGLISGSAYTSVRGNRIGRPVRMMALLEVGVSIAALAAYLLLAGIERVYVALSGGFHGAVASSLLGMLLVGAIVFVPGFLAGSGITLGLRMAVRPGNAGRRIAAALAVLILGLAGGTIASGFLLMPGLGALGTLIFGAGPLAAVGAYSLASERRPAQARRGTMLEVRDEDAAGGEPEKAGGSAIRDRAASALFVVFVFSIATCAIFWINMLGQFTGRTVYARAAAGGVFLASAGLAGLLAARLVPEGYGRRAVGLSMGAAGLAWLGLVFLEPHLPAAFIRIFNSGSATWASAVRSYFGLALLTLLVPGLLSGGASALAAGPKTGAKCVLPLAAGWLAAYLVSLFLPGTALGLKGVATGASVLAVASAVALLAVRVRRVLPGLSFPVVLAGACLLLTIYAPAWNAGAISSGVFIHPEKMAGIADLPARLRSVDVPFSETRDGSVVSVTRSGDGLVLRVDGVPLGSTADDFPSQILAAQLPLIMGSDAGNILILGFGTGITAGSVETHDVSRIECVEQSRSVIKASRYFSPYNLDALQDRRLSLTYCDPANYILLSRGRYDAVISSQPIPGEDFVRLARARLSPAGILCQTADLDLVGEDGLKSMAKEFAYFFPHVGLWWTSSSQVLLTGSTQPIAIENDSLINQLGVAAVKGDLARLGTMDNVGVLSFYLVGREALAGWAEDVPADRRGRSFLLYEAPKRLARSDNAQTFIELSLREENPVALIEGLGDNTAERTILGDQLARCVQARGGFFRSLAAARDGQLREAAGYLEGAAGNCPENGLFRWELSNFCITYSRALMRDNMFADAVNAARRAVETNPDNYRAYYNLATLESRRDLATARDLLRRAIQLNPDYLAASLMQAEVEVSAGMVNEASETLARILSIEPLNVRAHYLRALCFIQRGLIEDAKNDLAMVSKSEPDNVAALSALGYIYLLESDLNGAQRFYEKALKADPRSLEALNNLATVLAEKQQYGKAVGIWEKALEIDPANQDIRDNLSEAKQKMGQP